MQIAAHDTATGGHGPFIHAIDAGKRPDAVWAIAAADVNFIPCHRHVRGHMAGLHTGQLFVRRHGGGDIQQTKARRFSRGAFDAFGIIDPFAQHLIAAANAQDVAAAPHMRGQINIPPLRPQIRQISAG